ncbi:hypothetical protein DTM25_26290 [Escherichia coli]|uniref:Uncharacterized protein n=1 Tax=Escherichia coli TaxID=562 RepID=A0A2J7KK57_ECOLX|nr:hypothetical protein B9T59_17780 [Escherichia coli]EAB9245611.1 hypothetical protein [Escherichia coli]EEW7294826.1 hypothetical protein [Escherichia coli]EFO1707924.1 hypothetical protein [Escherichia coli]EFO2280607.1 hypothetical protein [Escherichia coli]
MSTLSTIHRPSYFPAYTFPIFHFSSPAPAPHCHLSEVLLSYTCNKKLFFCNSGMICNPASIKRVNLHIRYNKQER